MNTTTFRGLVILAVAVLQILAFKYSWIPVLFAIWILIAVGGLWFVSMRLKLLEMVVRALQNMRDSYRAFRSGW